MRRRPTPLVKGLVVLRRRYAHGIVIGIDGLDEHDPRHAAAPRASGHLREQLKGTLGRAKSGTPSPTSADTTPTNVTLGISCPLAIICVAHQNVVAALAKIVKNGLVLPLAGDGVAV